MSLVRVAIVPIISSLVIGLSAASAAPPADKKAERLWKAKCASCHGPDGKGSTEQGKKLAVTDMTTKEWQKSHTDDAIRKATKEGVPKTDKHGEMPGYDLTPEQIDSLVALMRSFGS